MAALAALAVPVGGQDRESPKSLLPEGFDAPAPPPPSAEVVLPDAITAPVADDALPGEAAPEEPDPFAEMASGADISRIGILTPQAGGYGPDIFAGSDGRFLAGLARRITAPGASRWAAIVLRRALLSQAQAPAGVTAGDWVAARAGLLLRIGEIDGAQRLTGIVPVDSYTPMLYRAAAQTALASGDIAGMCPIAETGRALWAEPEWDLAYAMCAAIAGDDITAASVFDGLRRERGGIARFDLRLAERVSTLAGGAGRTSGINWNEADGLTLYRFGVASAAGLTVPEDRLAALGPSRIGWLVRNGAVSPELRLALLRAAAAIGTLSSAELVSGVAALSAVDASGGYAEDSRAGRLRAGFSGDVRSRAAALARIRGDVAPGGDGYGALLETASAAARLPVTQGLAEDSPEIIAALLAAGDIRAAQRWWAVAQQADDAPRARAWASLAAAGAVTATPGGFRDWRSAAKASDRQAAMLLAGLAGTGAASGEDWESLRTELLPGTANSWTRAIDAAANAGRGGEVAILAATGLQGSWRDVPAAHVYHIVRGMMRGGRRTEARLIAAEALARA